MTAPDLTDLTPPDAPPAPQNAVEAWPDDAPRLALAVTARPRRAGSQVEIAIVAHRGELTLQSARVVGTTVTLVLPAPRAGRVKP